ncbi:MAG: PQQ-like beta-propeller repeat protein, partial [Pyrinomonadaceae bacterium]|nr:PQQ-like beta-propeller repeat protein [Pyrinomonadaceae bacterium]
MDQLKEEVVTFTPQLRQPKGSDLSRNSARVNDWANRVMANDPKVRAIARAALVQAAGRSLHGDLGGTLHCLDAATGVQLWKHETNEAIWGCLLLAGDRLYVGNVEGSMTVLRAGRRKELLAQIEMEAPLYSRPALIGDTLYLATADRLYLIAAKP